MSQRRLIRTSGSAVREVLILVIGILIAFWLDAWWSRRVESEEVRTELNNVLSELHENRRLVNRYLEWHGRATAASEAFLDLLLNDDSGTVLVADSVIWGTEFTPSFDPRTGAIDALLSSGRLPLIEDPLLRGALAGFGGYLTDARDEEMRARSYVDLQLAGILLRSGDVARATSSIEWRDQGGPANGASLYTSIQNSTELVNHLARRHLFGKLSIESLEAVRDQIDLLIDMIEATLAD